MMFRRCLMLLVKIFMEVVRIKKNVVIHKISTIVTVDRARAQTKLQLLTLTGYIKKQEHQQSD